VVPEERDAFAAAVVRVLEDRELQRELAQRGRVYARSWSSAAMAARLAELYQTLRSAPGAARVAA
jgi:glycosyltransferase involved in cell wall biosynthesis